VAVSETAKSNVLDALGLRRRKRYAAYFCFGNGKLGKKLLEMEASVVSYTYMPCVNCNLAKPCIASNLNVL